MRRSALLTLGVLVLASCDDVQPPTAADPADPTAAFSQSQGAQLADVIVVRGNPLFDINALGYVEHVVKGGVVYR